MPCDGRRLATYASAALVSTAALFWLQPAQVVPPTTEQLRKEPLVTSVFAHTCSETCRALGGDIRCRAKCKRAKRDAARQAPAELRKALLGRNRFALPLLIDAAKDAILTHMDAELLTQAVAALEGGTFDLVLMDLRMPVMDGFEAIKAIRAAEPPGQRLPIIVVSANAGPEDREASAAAGADRHIAKPIRAETLFGAISEVLEG